MIPLLVLFAGCATEPIPAVAETPPRDRLLRALDAHGSPGDATFEAQFEGTVDYEGHFAQPGATVVYRVNGSLLAHGNGTGTRTATLSGGNLGERQLTESLEVGSASCTHSDFGSPATQAPAPCPELARNLQTATPVGFLREALSRPESLIDLGPTDDGHAVGFTGGDGAIWHLRLRASDGLLVRAERPIGHPVWGDQHAWVEFDGWTAVDGVQLPTTRVAHALAADTRHTTTWTLSSWSVQPAKPAHYPIHSLNDGLFQVHVEDADARVLVVPLDQGLAVLGAPLSSAIGERLLDTIRAHRPDQRVRWIVVGHHHPHYAGGIRPFVHAGASVVSAASNRAYLTSLTAAPHTIRPDALQREPRAIDFVGVEGSLTLGSAERTLELHDIGPATGHTDAYLLAWISDAEMVYQDDLARFTDADSTRGVSSRERALHQSVVELGRPVRTLVSGWPLENTNSTGDWTAFDARVRAPE